MTRLLGVLVPALAAAGFAVLELGPHIADWWRIRRGRRAVRAVIEQETRRHVADLVPVQRASGDPVWWEFVPQDGDR